MTIFAHLLVSTLIGSTLGACATDSSSGKEPAYLDTSYTAFRDGLKECTARTGYMPDEAQSLGPFDLGQGELAWRECAYSALISFIVPNTNLPRLYMALIAKDKELTLGIVEKRITRDQRDAQIADQRDQIIKREQEGERMKSAMAEMEERKRQDMIMLSTYSLLTNLRHPAR